MRYKPEPVQKGYSSGGGSHKPNTVGWSVQLEKGDEEYIFEDQDDAVMFCLLLEIRDLLKLQDWQKRLQQEFEYSVDLSKETEGK